VAAQPCRWRAQCSPRPAAERLTALAEKIVDSPATAAAASARFGRSTPPRASPPLADLLPTAAALARPERAE